MPKQRYKKIVYYVKIYYNQLKNIVRLKKSRKWINSYPKENWLEPTYNLINSIKGIHREILGSSSKVRIKIKRIIMELGGGIKRNKNEDRRGKKNHWIG